jgi:hypothetical protein
MSRICSLLLPPRLSSSTPARLLVARVSLSLSQRGLSPLFILPGRGRRPAYATAGCLARPPVLSCRIADRARTPSLLGSLRFPRFAQLFQILCFDPVLGSGFTDLLLPFFFRSRAQPLTSVLLDFLDADGSIRIALCSFKNSQLP